MPRKRKTMSGADAQNIPSTAGVRYGEGDDMQELQQGLPSPNTAGTVGAGGTVPAPQAPQGEPVLPGQPPDPALVQQFLSQNQPALFKQGTQQPDVPLTDGLASGPGRGPEAMALDRTPTSRFLRQLASDTGNPKWRRLAERAGL